MNTPCDPDVLTLDWTRLREQFPARPAFAHKGMFGHVLVIGGNEGMLGAVRLAGEAALRSGAGLVSIATRQDHAKLIAAACPELMCHGVETSLDLRPLLARASVLVIGPGLGQDSWSHQRLLDTLASALPKVIDADALNLLPSVLSGIRHKHDWILTPHPGEAARLLQSTPQEIQQNRSLAVQRLQKCYGGVAILKGCGTLIQDAETTPMICPYGNPGMATAGMGDVLSGVLGALVAQTQDLSLAAKLGVMAHAISGDWAAQNWGARGLLSGDLLAFLPKVLNGLCDPL